MASPARRVLRLYTTEIASYFHRLRYDLVSEIVAAICGAVLIALFFYVFHDFLNVQVADLSTAMRNAFAEASAWTIFAIAVLSGIRAVRGEAGDPESLARWARRLGETSANAQMFRILRGLTLVLLAHGVAWFIIFEWLVIWPGGRVAALEAGGLIVTGLSLIRSQNEPRGGPAPEAQKSSTFPRYGSSAVSTLVRWRLRLITGRNRAAFLCFLVCLAFAVLTFETGRRGAPVFVSVAAAHAAGFMAAITLFFQLAEDLRFAWAERIFGVSHDDFLKAYQVLGLLVGMAAGILCAVFYAAGFTLSAAAFPAPNPAAKVFATAAVPAVVAPWILFQIDARKPAVNVLSLLIVSLFLGTAIFAHWLALLLLPIGQYYGRQSQQDRFYRA